MLGRSTRVSQVWSSHMQCVVSGVPVNPESLRTGCGL